MTLLGTDHTSAPGFPATLPDCILTSGFLYEPVGSTIRFAPATGAAKQRNRHTAVPWKMSGSIVVDLVQKNILDAFIKDDLKSGSLPFRKPDPVDPSQTWLWEFTAPLSYSPWQPEHFIVTLQLLRLPGTKQYTSDAFRLVDTRHKQLTDALKGWLRE